MNVVGSEMNVSSIDQEKIISGVVKEGKFVFFFLQELVTLDGPGGRDVFFCFFCTDMSITTKRRLFFSSVGRLLFSRRRFLCRELTAIMFGGVCPIC